MNSGPFGALTAYGASSSSHGPFSTSNSPGLNEDLVASNTSDSSSNVSCQATFGNVHGLESRPANTNSALRVWDSTTHVDPTLLVRHNLTDGLGAYRILSAGCTCSSPHIQLRTQGPVPSICHKMTIVKSERSKRLADPYANNLRVGQVCTTAAFLSLIKYVGIPDEAFCADASMSPFFRLIPESADYLAKSNMVDTVQKIFRTLKPDLRPSREQIIIPHHPYIDVLPFPTLRKNLIIHQEEIDEDELFPDILTGLVCWGSAGSERNDGEHATGFATTGKPWDARSWQAKGWFLKKYWTLLGGKDGELVRQSEWWRCMRGE